MASGGDWISPVRRSDIKDTAMDDGAFRLYCLLISMADKSGGCFPSNRTMAKDLGCKSPRTIQQRLERLEKLGRIKRTLDGTGHGREKIFVIGFKDHGFTPRNEIRGGTQADTLGERNEIHGGTQADAPKVLPVQGEANEGVAIEARIYSASQSNFSPDTAEKVRRSGGKARKPKEPKTRAADFDRAIREEAVSQRAGGHVLGSSPLIQAIEPFH